MAERVADYPRPPALVSSDAVIEVTALGVLICSTSSSLRVLETFTPHLLPAPDSVRRDLLVPGRGRSFASGKASPATGIWWWVSSVWRGHLEL